MYNYQNLIAEENITSIRQLHNFFFNEITQDWINAYAQMTDKTGVITLQNF